MTTDATPENDENPAPRRWLFRWLTSRTRSAFAEPASALQHDGSDDTPLHELAPVLEASPDPVLLIDAAGRIAAANAPARSRWAAIPGVRFSAILRYPPLLDAAEQALSAQGDEGAQGVDYVLTGHTQEHFVCSVAPLSWRGEAGALVIFRDRTKQIAAERMRVDFVANASHELRTPLTALSMLIETIAGPARDSEADRAKFLAMMQVQAERMRRLIDDLMALSRIEMDEHVPPSGSADLLAVAREAAASANTVAALRKVRIEAAGLDGEAPVAGDAFQLAQIAQNLIDNAVKFSPEGAVVRVEVGVAPSREEAVERGGRRWPEAGRISMVTPPPSAGRAFAYLRVSDEGPGIAMRHLPRLGERFFRVEREEGADRGGTGLGLAIVKHIVSRHRGGLIVESAPGRGSGFVVYFELVSVKPNDG